MSQALGLSALLSALREAGLPVGFTEQARLQHIFAQAPGLSTTEGGRALKSLLRAVLIKRSEDFETFDRVCDAWLEDAESAVRRSALARTAAPIQAVRAGPRRSHQPLPHRTSPRVPRLALAALALALAVAAWLIWKPPPPPNGTQPGATVVQPAAPVQPPPAIAVGDEPLKESFRSVRPKLIVLAATPHWTGWPELALGALALLTMGGAWWQLKRRRWLPEPEPAPTRQGPPRVWVQGKPGAPLLLGADDQQALVWGIGHFVSDALTRKLNLSATVRATARGGGFPSPVFQAARHQREVWLWLDESTEDPSLARLADEISELLPAYGLAIERATFWAVPDALSTSQGQQFAPKEIEERSHVALVAVLTDGRKLMRQYEADDRRVKVEALLRVLSHWPHLWFVDPTDGASGMREMLQRHAIACIHPRELTARLAGSSVVARKTVAATSDEAIWAAACGLSPAPVSETLAWQLHRDLNLSATPWAFTAFQRDARGPGGRLQWRAAQRAEHVNWLADCEVQGPAGSPSTALARALDFWEGAFDTEARQREAADGGTWRDSPAERHLRMERALLALWRRPSEAIRELHRLYQGALAQPMQEQLAALAPRDRGRKDQIHLPWRWADRSGPEQQMLLDMGFCGEALGKVQLRKPGRYWLGMTLGGSLAVGAMLVAITRPSVSPSGPPVVVHLGEKPAFAQDPVIPLADGQWRVHVTTPKWLAEATAPSAARVEVQWSAADHPCREQLDGAELWRCAARPEAARFKPALHRSLVVLAAPPDQAHALAQALLDSGSADLVLIDPAWPKQRALLLGTVAQTADAEQLLILHQDAGRPTAVEPTPGAAELSIPVDAWPALAKAMEFSGSRSAAEVWRAARKLAGEPRSVVLNGLPRECAPHEATDANGMVFVELCPGTFTMGSPASEKDRDYDETLHQVTLSAFAVGKHEVTNAQYRGFTPEHSQTDDEPVTNVSWSEAKAFCEHYGYRLPTEAQWEYAARAGTQTRWSFGDDEAQLTEHAWYAANSRNRVHPVGTRKPNPWGLHDLYGNVWEWVADLYGPYPAAPQTDPVGPSRGTFRVLRGGAFRGMLRNLRSADRDEIEPEDRYGLIGFRCARAPAASLVRSPH